MFQILKRLYELVQNLGIPFNQLIVILQKLLQVGPPPDVENEVAFKDWIEKLIIILGDLAAGTPAVVDDTVVSFLRKVVENETYWTILYGLIKTVLGRSDTQFQAIAVGTGINENDEMNACIKLSQAMAGSGSPPEAISPTFILEIAIAIVELIKLLRK